MDKMKNIFYNGRNKTAHDLCGAVAGHCRSGGPGRPNELLECFVE
jgi:hypothetical protein